MRLLVARHGLTQHNSESRFTGQTDAPLSPLGERQAAALAERLATSRFHAIVSSDLSRARATAERIAFRIGQPVILDPDLREIAMGVWEGRSVAEVRREWADLFERIETDPTGETAMPDGESWARFSARIRGALARWQARFPQGDVLWVTHGGVVSVLLLHALGLSYERRRQFSRGNTSLFEFDYRPTQVVIVRANDTSHLALLAADEEGEQAQVL
ncbi:MAG TPA: histidine phosphatase family protein [Ktedonobacterales bacterium]|jgi:broad specificity phosphatase PhoE